MVLCLLFVLLALQHFWLYFPQPRSGLCPPHSRGFLITYNDAPQSVGLLWTSDQSVAETSTWQYTTLTTDKHPRPRWDSNPQSQRASGRRLTAQTARSLGSADGTYACNLKYSLKSCWVGFCSLLIYTSTEFRIFLWALLWIRSLCVETATRTASSLHTADSVADM